jgi:SWI/SNF-related matrix-associated actin-dependent regulator 1 of chromatin subfamily A
MTGETLAGAPLQIDYTPQAHNAVQEQLRRLRAARTWLGNAGKPHVATPTTRKPMPHQWQAIRAIQELQGRVLLADDMGLGKTATSLWSAFYQDSRNVFVVCPASVKYNWAREIRMTIGYKTIVIDGVAKRRADQFAEAIGVVGTKMPLCIVINYDLLLQLNAAAIAFLKGFTLDNTVIYDESHYLKNREAQRTKLATSIAQGATNRLLLTGTPIWNLCDDLYSQIDIIRPGTWVSYWDFAKRHLEISPMTVGTRTFQKVRGAKNLKDLNVVVNTVQIRRMKEEVIDLPPKITTKPELELTGDHKRVYKAMKDLAVLKLSELDDSTSIFHPRAQSAVEAALRCEQIAQGFVGGVPEPLVEKLSKILSKQAKTIPGRPREIIFPNSPKIVWIIETIEGLLKAGKRPVVVSRFNAPMFWLAAHFECDLVLHGAITSKAKDQVVTQFQDGGQMMFMQVKMAQGFNLHQSQDCLFLGREWAPATNLQAEDRLHRIGQKGTVNIQIPIVRKTIETMIDAKLASKSADSEQALSTVTIRELMEAL